jgi:hypothetical protein
LLPRCTLDTRAAEASVLLALGVLGLTVGLVRAETASDLSILAAAAYSRSQLTERLAHAPLLDLIAILAGLPAIAAAADWAFGGRGTAIRRPGVTNETRISPR